MNFPPKRRGRRLRLRLRPGCCARFSFWTWNRCCPKNPARSCFLETLDLSAFYEPIKAVENRPGRPTTDPQVLLALWLLARLTARRLRLSTAESLLHFRVAHQEALDDLLTQIIGSLMAAGAVRFFLTPPVWPWVPRCHSESPRCHPGVSEVEGSRVRWVGRGARETLDSSLRSE